MEPNVTRNPSDLDIEYRMNKVDEMSYNLKQRQNKISVGKESLIYRQLTKLEEIWKESDRRKEEVERKRIENLKFQLKLPPILPLRRQQIMANDLDSSPKYSMKAWPRPIKPQQAMDLQKLLLGTPLPISKDWRESVFRFNSATSKAPWGLQTTVCGSRGIIMCVQAEILKSILFENASNNHMMTENLNIQDISMKGDFHSDLIQAIATIIWRAGEPMSCCYLCLDSGTSISKGFTSFRADGVTERVRIHKFTGKEELLAFLRTHMDDFKNYGGILRFVYSVILSRGTMNILEDAGKTEESHWVQLLSDWEEMSCSMMNLLLSGRAKSFMHNGSHIYDDKTGKLLAEPEYGLEARCDTGALVFSSDQHNAGQKQVEVGSMLKTPKYPIWITSANRQLGVLFCLKYDLINHWRAEHLFELYFYNGLVDRGNNYLKFSIDTRLSSKSPTSNKRKTTGIEGCILSKWPNANVETKTM